ncbi:MAG: T9SS type A sorting domain-containing protein, partial [Bacteroidota bacterium]|nr:T9SS type A sorting domain-containing protein [Bacteroidota bacterium]
EGGSGPMGTSSSFMQSAAPGIQSVLNDSIPVFGVEYLCNILLTQTSTFLTEKRNIDVVYHYAQKGMAKLFTAFQNGQIDSVRLNNTTTLLNNVQQHCLQNTALLPTAYTDRYRYSLDEAILFRDCGNKSKALNKLDSMKSWTRPRQLARVETWHCWINREVMLDQGLITIDEFMKLPSCNISLPHLTQQMPAAIETNVASERSLKVYPNPATQEINLVYNTTAQGQTTVRVTDLSGKTLITKTYILSPGENLMNFNLDNFAGGVYIVECEMDGFVSRQRFVVVR